MPQARQVNPVPGDLTSFYTDTGSTYSTSDNSGAYDVSKLSALQLSVSCTGSTGTSPTIQFFLDVSDKTGQFVAAAQTVQFTGAGQSVAVVNPVLGYQARVRWVIGGTTPTFTGVKVSLLGR